MSTSTSAASQIGIGEENNALENVDHGYHPSFALAVKGIVFSVEGHKFHTDAARLGRLSEPLRDMLFNSTEIGLTNEGTDESPIIIKGCTHTTFAHFLTWLDHISWKSLGIDPIVGNLDILHVCSLWSIQEGFDYAISELAKCNLPPAQRLHLARRYNIDEWFPSAVQDLLRTPFEFYKDSDSDLIGFPTFIALARAKEAIVAARQQFTSWLPFPKSMDGAPYCDAPKTCQEVWCTVWIRETVKLVHNPSIYTPLSEIAPELRKLPYLGMHTRCKDYMFDWLDTQFTGFRREALIINNAIVEIQALS